MPNKIQDADVKGSAEVTSDSRLINDTKIYITSLAKRFDQAVAAGDLGATYYDYDVNVNYVLNGDFEDGFGGWNTFQDPASSTPDNGTGGSANSTITQTTTNPLRGTTSLLFTKNSGASRQGEGFHYNFAIDRADQTKVLQGYFDYKIVSGTYTDNAMTVWIYDDTNLKLIPVTPYQIKNHATNGERFFFEFQTSPNSTNYRLIVYIAGTDTNAYSLQFDNFVIGPIAKLYGSPITDPKDYIPTYAGLGTVTTTEMKHWRSGSNVKVQGKITLGTTTASVASFTLPDGIIPNVTSIRHVGYAVFSGTTAAPVKVALLASPSSNLITMGVINASLTSASGTGIGSSGDILSIDLEVPIVGWSSSTIMSDGADTRVYQAKATSTAGQTIGTGSYTTIDLNATSFDTHGAVDLVNNRINILVSGYYQADCRIRYTASATSPGIRIRKNGSSDVSFIGRQDETVRDCFGTPDLGFLNAGDYLEFQAYHESGANRQLQADANSVYASIKRISGPAQIAASENIYGYYYTTAGPTINNTGPTITFGTRVTDSHASMSGNTLTIQSSGLYSFDMFVQTASASWTAGHALQCLLTTGGLQYAVSSTRTPAAGMSCESTGTIDLYLLAGATVTFQVYSDTSTTLSTTAHRARVQWKRIGLLSGPAQSASSESLVGVFTNVNNVNFTTSGTLQTVNYTNTIVDTFGGMSGSIYTVQQNGIYEVNADVLFGANGATIDAGCDLVITMGGTNYFMRNGALLNSTKETSVVCFASQRLTVGQTIFLQSRAYYTAGTPRMSNGLLASAKLSIKKVGI